MKNVFFFSELEVLQVTSVGAKLKVPEWSLPINIKTHNQSIEDLINTKTKESQSIEHLI